MSGTKYDGGKAQVSLVNPAFIKGVADVLTFGANKYAARNWEQGIDYDRVYSALQRHLLAWWSGEENDEETGISHLYHAACNIMFLSEFERMGMGEEFDPRKAEKESSIDKLHREAKEWVAKNASALNLDLEDPIDKVYREGMEKWRASRIDLVGQNGNDGGHYASDDTDKSS